jgi:dolichol-phosphate mannosyltransferase
VEKPYISVIIPTFREAGNIPLLLERIAQALRENYEVIIVDDDSRDGIEDIIRTLQRQYPVSLEVRRSLPRDLSLSVVAGLLLAKGEILVVMDGDLSHPAEVIPRMVEEIRQQRADFVIGSRFVDGGRASFGWGRRLNAELSRWPARLLVAVHDPLSGFFAFPRRLWRRDITLNPIGFKIGLELMVKLRPQIIRELPIVFENRGGGKSKLTFRERWKYLRHVARLLKFRCLSKQPLP